MAEEPRTPYEMPAQKASIPPEDTITSDIAAAQKTIQAQLDAINERDADAAYAFMSERAHKQFDNAKDFLSDMRFKFAPIYNHTDITFLHHYEQGNATVQKLRTRDRYTHKNATLVYKLVRQDNGQWLIDSFAVLELDDAQPI